MCKQGNIINIMNMNPHSTKSVFQVDSCIAPIVRILNENTLYTIASCCGHGKRPSNIVLADGREIFIVPDYDTARKTDKFFNTIGFKNINNKES